MHLLHLLGSKSQLIIEQKNRKIIDIICAFWQEKIDFRDKSHLSIGQKSRNNARYYNRVLREKNDFRRGGVEKILNIIGLF